MSPLRKFELGIISYQELSLNLYTKSTTVFSQLLPENIVSTHEKALNQGANDPTKCDYQQ